MCVFTKLQVFLAPQKLSASLQRPLSSRFFPLVGEFVTLYDGRLRDMNSNGAAMGVEQKRGSI